MANSPVARGLGRDAQLRFGGPFAAPALMDMRMRVCSRLRQCRMAAMSIGLSYAEAGRYLPSGATWGQTAGSSHPIYLVAGSMPGVACTTPDGTRRHTFEGHALSLSWRRCARRAHSRCGDG